MNRETLDRLAMQAMQMEDLPGIRIWEAGTKYHLFLHLICKELKPRRVLELGSYVGESTKYMALAAPDAEVWTVDINPDAKVQIDTVEPIMSNIRAFTADCVQFVRQYDGVPIDLLFIDANHDYNLTMANYRTWSPFVRSGGLIAMDDYTLDAEMLRFRAEMSALPVMEFPDMHATGFGILIKD